MSAQNEGKQLLILVRPDFVAAAANVATLKRVVAGLNQGSGGFASTPFGKQRPNIKMAQIFSSEQIWRPWPQIAGHMAALRMQTKNSS